MWLHQNKKKVKIVSGSLFDRKRDDTEVPH